MTPCCCECVGGLTSASVPPVQEDRANTRTSGKVSIFFSHAHPHVSTVCDVCRLRLSVLRISCRAYGAMLGNLMFMEPDATKSLASFIRTVLSCACSFLPSDRGCPRTCSGVRNQDVTPKEDPDRTNDRASSAVQTAPNCLLSAQNKVTNPKSGRCSSAVEREAARRSLLSSRRWPAEQIQNRTMDSKTAAAITHQRM